MLHCSHDAVLRLVASDAIDHVAFTGSVEAGRAVQRAAADRFIGVGLELGGKDPAIVLEDADLDRAVPSLTWGAFTNCGQVCASVERIYVQDSVAHEFTRRFVEHTGRLRQGPVLPPAGHPAINQPRIGLETDLGPESEPLHHARAKAFDHGIG